MTTTLAAAVLVFLFFAVLVRGWPEEVPRSALPLAVPAVALVLAHMVLIAHPGAGAAEAAALAAGRADPFLLLVPQEHQRATDTRVADVGGVRMALPHSPALRLLALPLAPLLGDAGAVRALGLAAVGVTVLLAFPLARDLGLGPVAAVVAQVLLLGLPVWAVALARGAYPALLGMAAGTLLMVHFVRRLDHLEGARDSAAACLFFAVAVASDGGAVLPASAFALVLAALEQAHRDWRRTLRILGTWAVALVSMALMFYAPFLVAFAREMLPDLRLGAPGWAQAGAILWSASGPLLLVAGLALGWAGLPARPRRVCLAALLAGALLVVLRTAMRWPLMAPPNLARGETLFLVAPLAGVAASLLVRAWSRGPFWRVVAALLTVAALGWASVAWRAAFA